MKTIKYTLHISDEEFKKKKKELKKELSGVEDIESEVLKALFFDHTDGYFGEIDHSNFEYGEKEVVNE